MDSGDEIARARRLGQLALGAMFLFLSGVLFFWAGLPLWACVLIAAMSIVVNGFVLRVEDQASSGPDAE